MKIETKDIRDGKHVGEVVWLCHYLHPDLNKKPLRNIPPTKVLVRSNEELPKNKRVYYSETHFSPIKKDGSPKATVISPVDNTGYRAYCGNELNVFTEKDECVEQWEKDVKNVCASLHEEELNAADRWKRQREELEARLNEVKE